MLSGPEERLMQLARDLKTLNGLLQESNFSQALADLNQQSTTDLGNTISDTVAPLLELVERTFEGGSDEREALTKKLLRAVNKLNAQSFTMNQLLTQEKYQQVIKNTKGGADTVKHILHLLQAPTQTLLDPAFTGDPSISQIIKQSNVKTKSAGFSHAQNELISTEDALAKTLTTLATIAANKEVDVVGKLQAARCPASAELLMLCTALQEYSTNIHLLLQRSKDDISVLSTPAAKKQISIYFTILTKASRLYEQSLDELSLKFNQSPQGLELAKAVKAAGGGSLDLSTMMAQPMQRIMRFEMLIKAMIENAPFEPDLQKHLLEQYLFFKELAAKANVTSQKAIARAKPTYLTGSFSRHGATESEGAQALFRRKSDGGLLDAKTSKTYPFVKALAGRGQGSPAGFYQTGEDSLILVKEDPENVMEGTAYFVKGTGLVPTTLESAANFAHVGVVDNKSVVSVQPGLSGKVVPWDEMVFGRKRNPKTLYSEEAWYPDAVKSNIHSLSSDAQWQLAAGLCISQAVGDESLHVGQYMAKLDKDDNVVGIVRVDFGARARYAVNRDYNSDYNHLVTSLDYASSGQYGKDYINYLVADPDLRHKLNILWASTALQPNFKKQIEQSSKEAFLTEFSKIPVYQQGKALTNLLETVNKNAKEPIQIPDEMKDFPEVVVFVAEKLASIDGNRAVSLQQSAILAVKASLVQNEINLKEAFGKEYLEKVHPTTLMGENILKGAILEGVNPDNLAIPVDAFIKSSNGILFNLLKTDTAMTPQQEKMILAQNQYMKDVLEAYKIALIKANPAAYKLEIQSLNKQLQACKTIDLCLEYASRTKSPSKKAYAIDIALRACQSDPELANNLWANSKMIDEFKTHTGYKWMGGTYTPTEGQYFLEKLFKNYGMPVTRIQFTEPQFELLKAIQTKDFVSAQKIMSGLTVYDALMPDRLGKTALHYLMEMADSEEAGDLIVDIAVKSLGSAYNTSLNVQDGEGNTPLHCLAKNAKAAEIRHKIDTAKGLNTYSGRYKTEHLFPEVKNKAGQKPSEIKPDERKSIKLLG